jgi:hypothetical protein
MIVLLAAQIITFKMLQFINVNLVIMHVNPAQQPSFLHPAQHARP